MRHATLDQWLAWQAGLHPRAIDPGLERVGCVADRLGLRPASVPVITVAGTNGKGSSVALLAAILGAAGYRVGAYTSPHLLRYNERIGLAGAPASDEAIMAAFDAIDQARAEISLSYFEFGTLAALWLFRAHCMDVAVLEVGLGGRLDAVNLLDADVALITSIGLDHGEWLGHDRESVGREKAGILRSGRPAVFAGAGIPDSVRGHAAVLEAPLRVAGEHYQWWLEADGTWTWTADGCERRGLPAPALPGAEQYRNAAGAIAALDAVAATLPVPDGALRRGLGDAVLPGRLQVLPGPVVWLLDVAHNAEAALVLAAELRRTPVAGHCHAVFGIMARKDAGPVIDALAPWVDCWWPLELPDADARPAASVRSELEARGARVEGAGDAAALVVRLREVTRAGDRVVVFGSFRTVEDMMHAVDAVGV